MAAKLYLVRHGQTEWNVAGRKQGHGDSPLTSVGVAQAKAIGAHLFDSGVFSNKLKIICSPLGRASATTQLICKSAKVPTARIETEPRLMETDYGAWEGLTKIEIEEKFPGQIEQRLSNHWYYVLPNGESYHDISIRVDSWLDSIKDAGPILAVTHDMVSRVIRKQYLGLSSTDALKLKHDQSEYYVLEDGQCLTHRVSSV